VSGHSAFDTVPKEPQAWVATKHCNEGVAPSLQILHEEHESLRAWFISTTSDLIGRSCQL